MISSSAPYNFICCNPQPSLIRLGIYFFRSPVRFGVWYIRISTLSAPNSDTSGANKDAHDASGDSLVPLKASVKILSFNLGLALRAFWSVDICTTRSTHIQFNSRTRTNYKFMFCFAYIQSRQKYTVFRAQDFGLFPSAFLLLYHIQFVPTFNVS
jgi:hypothetical protein